MTERRRPLENDDGQGALFGGEALAPAGPAPAWNRPARRGQPPAPDASSVEAQAAAPLTPVASPPEAGVDTEHAAPGEDTTTRGDLESGAGTPGAFEPGGGAPDAFEPGRAPDAFEPAGDAAAHDAGVTTPSPFADEIAELERATDGRAPRRPRAPLAGPTLDDVMSRAWEGLATGLPAACPVCHGEVVVAAAGPPRGRCSSCGTTIE